MVDKVRLISSLVVAMTTIVGPAYAGPELLSSLPAGTRGFLVVDVASARKAKVFERLMDMVQRHPKLGRLVKKAMGATGIDPRRDLTRALVVSVPGGAKVRWRGYVVMEGRFDRKRMAKKLDAARWLRREVRRGMVTWRKPGKGTVFTVLFLEDGALAFVHPSLVSEVVSAWKGAKAGRRASLPKEVTTLLAKPEQSATVWFASMVPPELKGDPDAGPFAQIGSVYGQLRMADRLVGTVESEFFDQQIAQQFAGFLQLARLRFAKHPKVVSLGLGPVLSRMNPTVRGKTVSVAVDLSMDELGPVVERVLAALSPRVRRVVSAGGPGANDDRKGKAGRPRKRPKKRAKGATR